MITTMISTRLASSRSMGCLPKAFTSVVMFFLASGRLMARIAGLRGFFRNRPISWEGGVGAFQSQRRKLLTVLLGWDSTLNLGSPRTGPIKLCSAGKD